MSFDDKLKEYYQGQYLNDAVINNLISTQKGNKPAISWIYMLVAACLIAVVSLVSVQQAANNPDSLDYIASEIAMNHNKHLAVEVETQDVALLRAALTKLDFTLKLPAHMEGLQLVMVGGRYCSVHGQIAAQVKLRRPEKDELVTLYVTRLFSSITSNLPHQRFVDGVQVNIWAEGGLLYGQAMSVE